LRLSGQFQLDELHFNHPDNPNYAENIAKGKECMILLARALPPYLACRQLISVVRVGVPWLV
jgi:hypothetical protein